MSRRRTSDSSFHNSESILPIGTKIGCYTIIGGFEEYQREVADPEIQHFQQEMDDFLKGIKKINSNVDSVDFFDQRIHEYKTRKYYKCQCKCGKVHYLEPWYVLEKKNRYCTEAITEKRLDDMRWIFKDAHGKDFSEEELFESFCGLAVEAWKKKIKTRRDNGRKDYAEFYDVDFVGRRFESLDILECIDNNYEELYSHGDLRKKDAYCYKISKLYKCRCYLCGKEYEVKCSQFHISPPTEYGIHAYYGYWSGVQCDCHEISSFQWIVNKLLYENNIPYQVEYSFPDLYGILGKKLLRFDFAVFHKDGSLKCLIKCQGEQHYKPIKEFGGLPHYEHQKKNDELKRMYINNNNIELIEISYKNKNYEEIKSILESHGII